MARDKIFEIDDKKRKDLDFEKNPYVEFCCICGEILCPTGECPNRCPADMDKESLVSGKIIDDEIRRNSLTKGYCTWCGREIDIEEEKCPKGCLDN